jgi:hypothetical protein
MKELLFTILLVLFLVTTSQAQLKVANFSYGKFATDKYEHFEFWMKDGKRTDISYVYGKDSKENKLRYLGKDVINGDSCFKVQFSNKYILYVIPTGLVLKVTDVTGKYNRTFIWEYAGPVNGIGTYCDVCANDEDEAMKIIEASYLK